VALDCPEVDLALPGRQRIVEAEDVMQVNPYELVRVGLEVSTRRDEPQSFIRMIMARVVPVAERPPFEPGKEGPEALEGRKLMITESVFQAQTDLFPLGSASPDIHDVEREKVMT